jgi:hypothetical protein
VAKSNANAQKPWHSKATAFDPLVNHARGQHAVRGRKKSAFLLVVGVCCFEACGAYVGVVQKMQHEEGAQ